jgi:hypothetical protein
MSDANGGEPEVEDFQLDAEDAGNIGRLDFLRAEYMTDDEYETDVEGYMGMACSPMGSDVGDNAPVEQEPSLGRTGQSSFADAFPGIANSLDRGDEQESRDQFTQGRVPRKLKAFWESNVPEDLKQFMVSPDDVFNPICMKPQPELLKLMCSKAKCMELLPADDQGLLYLPTYGSTMCWIAMGGSGELPAHIQDVLYFFSQVANSLGNYAHYVVPTTVTDIEVRASLPVAHDQIHDDCMTGGQV